MTNAAAQLPADIAQQLEQLHDIRLPQDISWWPLADGWWLLAFTLVAVIALMAVVLVRRRNSLRVKALHELGQLKRDAALQQQPARLAERAGALLKRVLLQEPQTQSLAASHGENWSHFLTQQPGVMDATIANFIAIAPYAEDTQATEIPSAAAILDAVEHWIRRTA